MKPKFIALGFLGLFVLGGAGFALFSLAERYVTVASKLRWAKQQEKIMVQSLEDLAQERKKLEDDQLDFASRVADQEQRLKALEEERVSLLGGLRRISERNRQLTLKEMTAEEVRSDVASLERERSEAEMRIEELQDVKQRLEHGLRATQRKLKQNRKRLKNNSAAIKSELEEQYEGEVKRLQEELKSVEEKMAGVSTLMSDRDALRSKLEQLHSERQLEQAAYFYNLGVVYTRGALFRKAAEMYEHALEINPDDPEAHHNLGILYDAHLNERDKAVEHYQRFLELSPDEKAKMQVRNWIGETESGIGHSRRTNVQTMREAFERFALPN